jgi:MacB-like periplasmic core domain
MPVGAAYFTVLGARPVLGQPFSRADERPNTRLAVVRERIWRKYLDASRDAVGRLLTLDGMPYRVVAVLSDNFSDPLEATSTCGYRSTCNQADRTPSTTTI